VWVYAVVPCSVFLATFIFVPGLVVGNTLSRFFIMALHHQIIPCNNEYFEHFYLCHYKPRHAGYDTVSQSLINYKRGHPLHVAAWNSCALQELRAMPLSGRCVILRALTSDELSVTVDTPLDVLGRKLADEVQGHYATNLLSKARQTSAVKYLTRDKRAEELLGVYHFESSKEDIDDILILDDILTTATTVREIIKSIRVILPNCRIRVFTLASSDRDAVVNSSVRLVSLSYQWFPDTGWGVVAEGLEFYENLHTLKRQILADHFDDA